MSGQAQSVKFDLAAQGVKQPRARVLLAAPASPTDSVALNDVTIPAFGVVIATVK